jgi:transposase
MNMGINGLSKIVCNEMSQPLLGGDVFIFFGKSRQMVKLLCWDGDGFLLYQKRLEKGTFELPMFKAGQKAAEMPYRTLSAIMRGVSLKSVRYRSRLRIGKLETLQPSGNQ